MSEEKTITYENAVLEVRKACRQFAMLYFNFCRVLVESLGLDNAKPIIQKAVFNLALDRTDRLRRTAAERGLPLTKETFDAINDLPRIGWDKALGQNHCPYAEAWRPYFEKYPWFSKLAPLYCDVIDTTNIENFSGELSHRLVKNVLNGDETCERIYFPEERVKAGKLTYGER